MGYNQLKEDDAQYQWVGLAQIVGVRHKWTTAALETYKGVGLERQ